MEDIVKNLLKRIDKLQKDLLENSADQEKSKTFSDRLENLKAFLNAKTKKPEKKLKQLEQRLTEAERAVALHLTAGTDQNRNETPTSSRSSSNNNEHGDRSVSNVRNRKSTPVVCESIDLTDDDQSFVENHNRLEKYLTKSGTCTDEDVEAFSRNIDTVTSNIYGPPLLPTVSICNAMPAVPDNMQTFPKEKLSTFLEKVMDQQSTSAIPPVTEFMGLQSTSAVPPVTEFMTQQSTSAIPPVTEFMGQPSTFAIATEMVVEEKKCPLDNIDLSKLKEILENANNNLPNNNVINAANELNTTSTVTEAQPSGSENNLTKEPDELNEPTAETNASSSEEARFEIDIFTKDDPVLPTIERSRDSQPSNVALHTSEMNDVLECVDMVISDSSSEVSTSLDSSPRPTEGQLKKSRPQIRFNLIPQSIILKKSPLIQTSKSSFKNVTSKKESVVRADSADVKNNKETTVIPVSPPIPSETAPVLPPMPLEPAPVPPPLPSEPAPVFPPVPVEAAPAFVPLASPVQKAATPSVRSETNKRVSKVSPVEKPVSTVSARARLIQSFPEVHKLGEPGKVSGALKLLRTDLLTQAAAKESSVPVECAGNSSSSSQLNAVTNICVRSDPPTNNVPFTHSRDPRRAAGIMPRSPIQPNYGRSPGQSDFARSPSEPDYGRSPSQPDYRRSPSQPDYRRSPSQPDYRRSPSQPDYGRSPSQPDYGRSPSQPDYGRSPSQPDFGRSPSQPDFGRSPSQPDFGRSPSQPDFGRSPQQPIFGRSPSQPEFSCSSRQTEFSRVSNQSQFRNNHSSIQTQNLQLTSQAEFASGSPSQRNCDNRSSNQLETGSRTLSQPNYRCRSPSQPSYGNRLPSRLNYGNQSSNQLDSGCRSPGQPDYGGPSSSQASYGNRSPCRPNYGNRSPSWPSYGNRLSDQLESGSRSPGQPEYGDHSPSRTSYGNRSPSRPNYGNRSPSRPNYGNRSPSRPNYGNRSPSRPNYGNRSPSSPNYGNQSPSRPNYGDRSPNQSNKGYRSPTLPLNQAPSQPTFSRPSKQSSTAEKNFPSAKPSHEPASLQNQKRSRGASRGARRPQNHRPQRSVTTAPMKDTRKTVKSSTELGDPLQNIFTPGTGSISQYKIPKVPKPVTEKVIDDDNWDTVIQSSTAEENEDTIMSASNITSNSDDENWDDLLTQLDSSTSTTNMSPKTVPASAQLLPKIVATSSLDDQKWDNTPAASPSPSLDDKSCSNKINASISAQTESPSHAKDELENSEPEYSPPSPVVRDSSPEQNRDWEEESTDPAPSSDEDESSKKTRKFDKTAESERRHSEDIVTVPLLSSDEDESDGGKVNNENRRDVNHSVRTEIASVKPTESSISIDLTDELPPTVKDEIIEIEDDSDVEEKPKVENLLLDINKSKTTSESEVSRSLDKPDSSQNAEKSETNQKTKKPEVNQPKYNDTEKSEKKQKVKLNSTESNVSVNIRSQDKTLVNSEMNSNNNISSKKKRGRPKTLGEIKKRKSLSPDTNKKPTKHAKKTCIKNEKKTKQRRKSRTESVAAELNRLHKDLHMSEGTKRSISYITGKRSCTLQQPANYNEDPLKGYNLEEKVPIRRLSAHYYQPAHEDIAGQEVTAEEPCSNGSLLQGEGEISSMTDTVKESSSTVQQSAPQCSGETVKVKSRKSSEDLSTPCNKTASSIKMKEDFSEERTSHEEETRLICEQDITVAKTSICHKLAKKRDDAAVTKQYGDTTELNDADLFEQMKTTTISVELSRIKINENSIHKNEGKIGCSSCSYIGRSNNDLANHQRSCHWSLNCIFCDKVLYGSEGLKQHFQNKVVDRFECILVQKRVLLLCPYCPYCTDGVTYDRYLFLEKHVLVDHCKKTMPTIKVKFTDKERDLLEYELAMMQSEWNNEIERQAKTFEIVIPRTVKLRNVAVKSTARVKRSEIERLQRKCTVSS